MAEAEFVAAIDPSDRGSAGDWVQAPNVRLVDHSTEALTPLDLIAPVPAALRDSDLLWWPHINVPRNVARPLVVTLHDVAPIALPAAQVEFSARVGFRMFLHRVRTHATAIACPSEFTRAEAARLAGFAPRDLQVVPLGPGRVAPSQLISVDDPSPYFLFIGSIKKHKRLDTLLDAFALLTERLPHRLVVVGAFEELRSADQRAYAAMRGMRERVRYLGRVDDETLAPVLAGAEALVFPSAYEGFGLPPLEAMTARVPVIAASASALPEVLGKAPLWFEPGNTVQLAAAMERIATEKGLRSRLVAAGVEQASRYSWERCAEAMAGVLDRAAAKGR